VPAEDGGWTHKSITLYPDSDRPEFVPFVLEMDSEELSNSVIAELLMVLSPVFN